MAEVSRIEWTDATFNPWIGCTKISPACDHCYAEDWAKRYGHVTWGGPRKRTSAATWRQPVKLNAKALAEGRRIRVFCASLADVFDNQVPAEWRDDLWALIRVTPALDWLLLTKRPQNIAKMLPADWDNGYPNVALGTTVEDQQRADQRIPALLAVPAVRRFLSCEPLLGPVDLTHVKMIDGPMEGGGWETGWESALNGKRFDVWAGEEVDGFAKIDWVIAGGESGAAPRPSHPDWFRSLRDQCAAAGVPFLFKQWGEYGAYRTHAICEGAPGELVRSTVISSTDRSEVGKHYFYAVPMAGQRSGVHEVDVLKRVGKARAGRLLDGVLHNGFPT